MRARIVGVAFVLGLVAVGVAVAGANGNWSTHASGALEVPARDTNAQAQAACCPRARSPRRTSSGHSPA
jgi:hypothetical protein